MKHSVVFEMHHFQPILYNDNIYIICALTGKYPGETPIPNIYYCNVTSDTWSKGVEILEDCLRGSTGNVLKGDVVYISYGIKDGHRSDHKNWLDTYNLIIGKSYLIHLE